jgi:hypothetical protein
MALSFPQPGHPKFVVHPLAVGGEPLTLSSSTCEALVLPCQLQRLEMPDSMFQPLFRSLRLLDRYRLSGPNNSFPQLEYIWGYYQRAELLKFSTSPPRLGYPIV